MKSFGEDPQKMQPDEFFGMFDQFVASFNDARVENQKFRKQKEEEEKRARLEIQVEYKFSSSVNPVELTRSTDEVR